ncbi:hypothetical protein V6N12_002853 [Hibiscus sabdariffa]|uniref:Uncharacterized protein n=1 Tax=Hibiscus sabdariffa TaxID=183260 RepID=A0ABR2EBZ8_9ROSI
MFEHGAFKGSGGRNPTKKERKKGAVGPESPSTIGWRWRSGGGGSNLARGHETRGQVQPDLLVCPGQASPSLGHSNEAYECSPSSPPAKPSREKGVVGFLGARPSREV